MVGKQIDNALALHALTQQRANAVVDFRFRHFRPAAVEFCQEHTHRVEQRHFQFLIIGEQRAAQRGGIVQSAAVLHKFGSVGIYLLRVGKEVDRHFYDVGFHGIASAEEVAVIEIV